MNSYTHTHMQTLRHALLLLVGVGIVALPAIILFQETHSEEGEVRRFIMLSILAGCACGVVLRSWWTMAVIPVGPLIPILYVYATHDLGTQALPFSLVASIYLVGGALPAMLASVPGVLFGRSLVSDAGTQDRRGRAAD